MNQKVEIKDKISSFSIILFKYMENDVIQLFMKNHRYFRDFWTYLVQFVKKSSRWQKGLIVFFYLNMSMESVFRVEGEIGYA